MQNLSKGKFTFDRMNLFLNCVHDNGQFRKGPNSKAVFRPQEPGTKEL
jgi:hypothetical protein